MPKKYDEDFKTRSVRSVTDHVEEYDSPTARIIAVAKRLSVAPAALRRWINQHQVDAGRRAGVSSDVVRENRELEEALDIRTGGNEFPRAGERPATPLICRFIAEHRARVGVAPICRVLTEHGCRIAPRTFYAGSSRPPSARAL